MITNLVFVVDSLATLDTDIFQKNINRKMAQAFEHNPTPNF